MHQSGANNCRFHLWLICSNTRCGIPHTRMRAHTHTCTGHMCTQTHTHFMSNGRLLGPGDPPARIPNQFRASKEDSKKGDRIFHEHQSLMSNTPMGYAPPSLSKEALSSLVHMLVHITRETRECYRHDTYSPRHARSVSLKPKTKLQPLRANTTNRINNQYRTIFFVVYFVGGGLIASPC